jgi:putative sterol carrier protein
MDPTDEVAEFFRELGERGYEPLLAKVRGWVRFELEESGQIDQWLVAVDAGVIAVSHTGGPAECTARLDRGLFIRLCRGEGNAIAAVLRGEAVASGDIQLLLAMARLFPALPIARQPQSSMGGS